ncbi:hypothetical protein LTR65_009865 [Meristemomyces frigidus]
MRDANDSGVLQPEFLGNVPMPVLPLINELELLLYANLNESWTQSEKAVPISLFTHVDCERFQDLVHPKRSE